MNEQLVAAGRKGGILKWSKIKKKKRSEIMREVALARWKNRPKQLKEKKV